MKAGLLLLLALAAVACVDAREAQVERCVDAYLKVGRIEEGPARVICMSAAYGNRAVQQ